MGVQDKGREKMKNKLLIVSIGTVIILILAGITPVVLAQETKITKIEHEIITDKEKIIRVITQKDLSKEMDKIYSNPKTIYNMEFLRNGVNTTGVIMPKLCWLYILFLTTLVLLGYEDLATVLMIFAYIPCFSVPPYDGVNCPCENIQ